MDSTLKEISDHPDVWRQFMDAFGVHFPGVPLDGSGSEAATLSVNAILEYIPGVSDALRNELAAALTPTPPTIT